MNIYRIKNKHTSVHHPIVFSSKRLCQDVLKGNGYMPYEWELEEYSLIPQDVCPCCGGWEIVYNEVQRKYEPCFKCKH